MTRRTLFDDVGTTSLICCHDPIILLADITDPLERLFYLQQLRVNNDQDIVDGELNGEKIDKVTKVDQGKQLCASFASFAWTETRLIASPSRRLTFSTNDNDQGSMDGGLNGGRILKVTEANQGKHHFSFTSFAWTDTRIVESSVKPDGARDPR